jgi:hypothetical protein
MLLISYLLLLLCYLVTGYGVLTVFRLRLKTAYMVTLSLLCGIAVASVVPFLLQLLYIPLTPASVFGTLVLAALALNIPTIRLLRREGLPAVRRSFKAPAFRVLPYEIPFLAIFTFFALVSIWRCYYLPPTSRDALSGPEAIAEFAVREHTMINSFFNIDLSTTNNQFKSPFLVSLQVISKMAGFQFGQVWLSVAFVSFTIFLYHALKERLHPVVAGLLLLLFLMTPEVYAYTFMILYDYSNMIFFFLSLWFLFGYFRNNLSAWFYFSGFLMGVATYIRSETLVLAFLFLPPILLAQRRQRLAPGKIVLADLYYFLPSLLGYLLPGPLYIGHYLPAHYDVGNLINPNMGELGPLFQRYSDMGTHLIASTFGIQLWGYFYYFAAFLLVAEIFFRGRFNREARNWLYAMLVLYLGIGALGFILPLIDLNDTTKRELFKMLPLLLLYLANNAALIRLSQWISRWEGVPIVIGAPLSHAVKSGASGSTLGSRGPGASKAVSASRTPGAKPGSGSPKKRPKK